MAREFHVTDEAEKAEQKAPAAEKKESTEKSGKKKNPVVLVAAIAAALFVIIGGSIAFLAITGRDFDSAYESGSNGAMIVQADESMTEEEIAKMLAEQATSMHVHVWSAPAINGDTLSVGFENDAGNKYDQAFQVIQNDEVIYESFPVAPGEEVKSVSCPKARVGRATIEIFNVVDGTRYGNGVRCEVVIIGTDNDGNRAERVEDVTGVLEDTEPAAEDTVDDAAAETETESETEAAE